MKQLNFKNLSDKELRNVHKILRNIIKVIDGKSYINERVLSKLPESIIKQIDLNREKYSNVFNIATELGKIDKEIVKRWIKDQNQINT